MHLSRWLVLVAATSAALAVSACGESEETSDAGSQPQGVAEAEQAVREGMKPLEFKAPGPAFEVADDLEGRTIWFVANGLNFPFSQNLLAGIEDAAAVVGMKVTAVDGAGQPAKAASLIQQAIGQRAAAIVILTFPTDSVTEPIRAAKRAGIPVVQLNDGDPGLPSPEAREAGVFANVSSCYGCGGRQLANLVMADSGGGASVVFVDVPDIRTTLVERDAFEERLAELCSDCEVTTKSAPVAQWGRLSTLTASALREDPTVDYLIPAVDAMIALMKPAVFAANAADRIKMASYNATKPVMEDLRRGELVIGGVGNPEEWMGWGAVDEVLRALSGEPPLADELIPHRTFTKDNVDTLDLSAPAVTWYGDPGFREGYEALWETGT